MKIKHWQGYGIVNAVKKGKIETVINKDLHIGNYGEELNKIVNIPDAISGPGICFHDTQGFNVEAKEIKIINGKFSCKLVYDFYDHFGLDLNDIQTYENSGFKEWYLLQHLGTQYETKCKAFVNHIIHEKVLELEVE